ncbi:leucine-rich repeat [Perkinsela sp. CCAP 1560/4]|nr:leucine-rich repeat [Perkinsela sp. CCAP 1560/4]|eukprot:KNH06850.1 leucine-rich repeat [Perkinsela sp. CCAP 1560/4]
MQRKLTEPADKIRAAHVNTIQKIQNHLSGSVVLTQLLSNLKYLFLTSNQLSGPLNLTKLPPNMCRLRVDKNTFSGTVDISDLPQGLVELKLLCNDYLTGEVSISDELFDRVNVKNTKIVKQHAE